MYIDIIHTLHSHHMYTFSSIYTYNNTLRVYVHTVLLRLSVEHAGTGICTLFPVSVITGIIIHSAGSNTSQEIQHHRQCCHLS
jgi:hypothetical protein